MSGLALISLPLEQTHEDEERIVLGTPVQLLVGIILLVFAMFLFFLEKVKPGCKRESDNIYSALSLATGILSLLSMADQNPFHAFQLVIFTGVFIALALEAINGRTPDNSPMKQSGGMSSRDDDRSPRNYRAGVEENYTAMDDRGSRRQMREGRGGRDEADSRSSGRNDRDRFLEDRPRRKSRYDEQDAPDLGWGMDRGTDRGMDRGADRGRRPSRDEFGDDIRSIPERSSASDSPSSNSSGRGRGRDGDRNPMNPIGMNNPQSMDDVPRPRRRPMNEDVSPPSRGRPPANEDSSTSDYVEFRPVEPIPPKESWGPKDS